MGKIVFVSWAEEKSMLRSAKALYFLEKGHDVDYIFGVETEEEWMSLLSGYDHIMCYNGSRIESLPYKHASENLGIPMSYYENGILPARANQFVDRKGVLGHSSFCQNISWVGQKEMDELVEWKDWYLKELGISEEESVWSGGDYIFCPMQCHWDANFCVLNGWSPFTGKNAMTDFMNEIQDKNPNEKIIFRCHPADMKAFEDYKELVRDGNEILPSNWANKVSQHEPELIRLMLRSNKVIGVNTTCLLQSCLLQVPTEALGWGYVKSAGESLENRLKMVAAVRSRSFHWQDKERAFRIMDEVHKPGEVFWK